MISTKMSGTKRQPFKGCLASAAGAGSFGESSESGRSGSVSGQRCAEAASEQREGHQGRGS